MMLLASQITSPRPRARLQRHQSRRVRVLLTELTTKINSMPSILSRENAHVQSLMLTLPVKSAISERLEAVGTGVTTPSKCRPDEAIPSLVTAVSNVNVHVSRYDTDIKWHSADTKMAF